MTSLTSLLCFLSLVSSSLAASRGRRSKHPGLIEGVVVAVIFIIIVLLVVYCVLRKRRRAAGQIRKPAAPPNDATQNQHQTGVPMSTAYNGSPPTATPANQEAGYGGYRKQDDSAAGGPPGPPPQAHHATGPGNTDFVGGFRA